MKITDTIEINKIYYEDDLKTMARMPDNFIDLTVTSPPYDDLRTYQGYSFDFEGTAKELYRVTKIGGVVVWVVGDSTINGSETGTSFKQALYFMECGFNLHDTMIYQKPAAPFPGVVRYMNVFEYMFVFSKGEPKITNIILDRKNNNAGMVFRNTIRQKDGTLKQQITKPCKDFGERYNIWFIVNGEQIKEHPATFPEKLAADHIYSWSNKGDLIYDPFGGSGTVAKMCILMKGNYILSEISKEYCELAEKRILPYKLQLNLGI